MEQITSFLINLFSGNNIALLSVTFCAAFAGYGSARGVGAVGSVAAGVLTEDPGKYGRLLILQALPGSQGIYGLIVWFMYLILGGYFATPLEMSMSQGLMITAACIPMGLVGYFSAIYQAKVACAGCALVAKRPEESSKAIILASMVETYAIFALLITMLTLFFVVR